MVLSVPNRFRYEYSLPSELEANSCASYITGFAATNSFILCAEAKSGIERKTLASAKEVFAD